MAGLNYAAQSVEDEQTTISDYKIVLCTKVVHKAVVEIGWNFIIKKLLQKGNRGLFLIISAQNNVFSFEKSHWKFNKK